MTIFNNPVLFEWSKGNDDKNLIKHGVSNQEAEETFKNEPFLLSKDIKHSKKEERFQVLGKTNMERRLFISFTIRNEKIRIISARDMNKKERSVYEKV